MGEKLQQTIARIGDLHREKMEEVRHYQNTLTKPAGSLGKLEDLSIQLAGITGEKTPDLSKKAVIVMAGDHGVVEEGISAFPQVVTQQMVLNFVNGGAGINVLARHVGAEVRIVDMGIIVDMNEPTVWNRKVKYGTDNFTKGPAMSREEAVRTLEAGIGVAEEMIQVGYRVLATAEMGIGNTTASSAIVSLLAGASVEAAVGPGTGIDRPGMQRKIDVIRRGIEVNRPDQDDALDVLSKVGGLEIAGLAGLILGCAAHRVPIVIDGFISTAAALVAKGIAQKSAAYMIGSHCSAEPAHRLSLQSLGLTHLLELNMRLGEGTGAVLSFPLIEAAVRIVREMATFASAGVSQNG